MNIHREFAPLPLLNMRFSPEGFRALPPMDNVVLVCVQHLLETTGSLLEAAIRLGIRPNRIHILGKAYSSHDGMEDRLRGLGVQVLTGRPALSPGFFGVQFKEDCDRLWEQVVLDCHTHGADKIIVLDDGGHCLMGVPLELSKNIPIVGIEQTTNGLARIQDLRTFPIVEVASSAAKVLIEPPMITRAVLQRAKSALAGEAGRVRCGIVGLGNIGGSLANTLDFLGYPVLAFDRNPMLNLDGTGIKPCGSLKDLVAQADVVFGCTGEDIFAGCEGLMGDLQSTKRLVSCSSEDVEFRSVLQQCLPESATLPQGRIAFDNLSIRVQKTEYQIFRAGFPVNFDGSNESVPGTDIQITRFLLLSGIIQALEADTSVSRIMLDPEAQRRGTLEWLSLYPNRRADYSEDVKSGFKYLGWIEAHSGGTRSKVMEPSFRGRTVERGA